METPAMYTDHLNDITDLAEKLTPISDIALLLNLDVLELRELIRDKTTAVSVSYRLGKARGLLSVRQAAMKKAADGDLSAAATVQHYHSLMDDDETL